MLKNKSLAMAATLLLVAVGRAEENRFTLVDQLQGWANRGVSIGLENSSPKPGLLPVGTIHFVLTIGDGKKIRVLDPQVTLSPNRPIRLRAVISPTGTTVSIDGKSFESPGGYEPSLSDTAEIGGTYVWAKSRTAYRIEESDYRLASGTLEVKGDATNPVKGQLALFEFPLAKTVAFKSGPSLTFETTFQIVPIVPSDLAGAVDRYGQAAAADWPDKVRSDTDLLRSIKEEQERAKNWKRPSDWDQYGGQKGVWKEKPTGFYRVTKREGKWWILSPEGNPLFYTGLCTAPALKWETTPVGGRESIFQALPPKTGETAGLWQENDPWGGGKLDNVALHSWNLVRKFGKGWEQQATQEFARRMGQWGFSGQGKFTDEVPGMPRLETLGLGNTPKLVRHVDVFDPAACKAARNTLAKIVLPLAKEPRILGFSVENEFEGVFTTDEIREVLEKHKDSPASVAIRKAVALSEPPTPDQIEKARRFYADAYYAFMYKTIKSLAPKHLYFGYWVSPGWWQNDADWDMVVPHCDVVGYDQYSPRYGGRDGLVTNLIARFDKPTLVGEFASPPWYGGTRGFGWYSTFVETDADAGRQYAQYVADAAADPRCVGTMYFQYRDEPIVGRGGGRGLDLVIGENFAFGFVDITDRPKWDFVALAREANLRATKDRLKPSVAR
ncbi:hypothetical protein BH11ARM2_BH11ARM2_26880 [soil metagenome]